MTIAELFNKEREEGIEEGIEKKATETALKMLKEGVELAFIFKITDLSIEKIKKLQKLINLEDK